MIQQSSILLGVLVMLLVAGTSAVAAGSIGIGPSCTGQDSGQNDAVTPSESMEFVGRAEARNDRSRSLDIARSKARLQAVRRLIESRLVLDPRWTALSPAVRAVGRSLVVGYMQEAIDLSGRLMFDEEVDGRLVTTTLTVPQGLLEEHRISVDGVLIKGLARSESDEASFLERALILELLGPDDPRADSHRAAMVDTLGPCFQSSIRGEWLPTSVQQASGPPSQPHSLQVWAESSLQLITADRVLPATPGMVYGDVEPPSIPDDVSIERLIGLVFEYENRPDLVREVGLRLDADGWSSTAAIFRTEADRLPLVSPLPPHAARSEMSRNLITLVLDTHQLLRQYVSEGMAPVRAAASPGPEYQGALKAFGEGGETAVLRAGAILASSASGHDLAVDEWSLLSAVMFALDERALARAFARTAFRIDPTHPYAGVNAVRATLALGFDEEATGLMARVAATARLDGWGRGQLDGARLRLVDRAEVIGRQSSEGHPRAVISEEEAAAAELGPGTEVDQ